MSAIGTAVRATDAVIRKFDPLVDRDVVITVVPFGLNPG